MPRHPCGLARRAHRVRPSEKTTIRIVPGFSPEASHPSLPPRGGAGSARPQREIGLTGHMSPVGHHGLLPPMIKCYASASVRPCKADAQSAPLRENHHPHCPRVFPRGLSPKLATPRRGGLRTPANGTLLGSRDRPIRPPGVRLPPLTMSCLGLRQASQRGRAERVPPRKSPFALCQGFPRKAILA
jgi:hypothetical protein